MRTFGNSGSFVALGWRRALHERLVIAVPMLTYALLVAVFTSIFQATPLAELPDRIRVSAPELIWYLVLTEMITFAGGYTFPEVRSDVLDGQFAAAVTRPMSYFRTKLWGWVGQSALRVMVFFALGLLLAGTLSGRFVSWQLLPVMLLSVALGALLHGIVYCSLALLEVWGPYARPAMWISQKLCFLLGGLLLPITFYPDWLQTVAWLTPYPAILNVSGRLALHPSLDLVIDGLLVQIFWLGAAIALAFLVQHLAVRRILTRGH